MPAYAMLCPKGHGFDVYARMADPPRTSPCSCGETATRDYASEMKTKQIGFIDGVSLCHLPHDSGAPLAHDPKNPTLRAVKNKHEWKELCKRNDWTDYSNSSGPPE